ncbi:hypothetical protein [Aureibaculum conchae]|uniref:hypothetical protein n=1 Tax=Aureibaculum sp. 2308TA14-22 TaxID=3108392 RepID=UPI003395F6D1
MNKSINLTLSGICLLIAGVLIIASKSIGVSLTKILVPLSFIACGVFSYLFSQANKQHKIAYSYHLMQSIGLVLFGLLIAFSPNSLQSFLMYICFFLMLYGLLEILFGFSALNTRFKINWSMLITRFITGFLSMIGSVYLLLTMMDDEIKGVKIAGVLTILGGLSFVWFAQKVKNLQQES